MKHPGDSERQAFYQLCDEARCAPDSAFWQPDPIGYLASRSKRSRAEVQRIVKAYQKAPSAPGAHIGTIKL